MECHHAGLLSGGGNVMCLPDSVDTIEVGYHKTVEIPVFMQHVGQEIAVGRTRNAVERVVRRHDRKGTGIDGPFERGQKVLVYLAHAEECWVAVLAAFGGAVADEMLQSGQCRVRIA